jgi:hypothetical protein
VGALALHGGSSTWTFGGFLDAYTRMKTTERPLNTEELDEIARFSSEGISALGVDADDQPKSIITAIDLYVDKQRLNIQLASEDDYASLILSMAFLWGNQVCRAHGWKWVMLVYGEGEAKAIVSRNRACFVYPLHFFKDLIDDPQRESTIILLFNMLAPWVLSEQFPKSEPGRYDRLQ